MENITVRKVHIGDEKTLAFIQTESWKAAFCDILPPDVLERCTQIEKAEKMYSSLLLENKGNGLILEVDSAPHCLAYWDRSRCEGMEDYAELIAIHSLPVGWHKGYGSVMIERVFEEARNAGFNKIMLWVFEENERAISFYKHHGFRQNDRKKPALGKTEVMFEKTL